MTSKAIISEAKFDNAVRTVVKDIVALFKHQRKGEFGLPEDIRPDELTYSFPDISTNFSIFLDLQLNPEVEEFDVDADFLRDDDLIYLTIISNPDAKYSIIQKLIGELNEVIRHEFEHIKQMESGYKFPKEPKSSEKYYSQKHELEAQKAGFKRRARKEKVDFETLVRKWFDSNKHKHNLNPKQAERVIQRILDISI